jgi:outer membrane cobalamin receptor
MNSRTVDRINMAGSIVNEIPFEINEWILNILGAIRLDFYSDLNWFWGLTTGINIENPRIPLSFRGQFSTNYRMPSFNELYYFNYGSKDLKPEKSISSNFGLSLEFFSNLKLNIDAYYINTVDQIVSVPKSPIVWNATNIGKVVTKGIEISSSISLFDSLFKFSLAYTLQNAIDESENSLTKGKLIPYIPQEMIKATAFCNLDKLTFIISADYNSFRFSLPDNSYNSLLPAFFTIDLSGNYQFNLWKSKINLIFTIKNLLNTRYSIIMNYPMPGIIIRGGVGLEL